MSYPGNPNLAEDVQRRVLSTFESMLREVAQGKHEEALLGCTLIERMDPDFQPVGTLRDRLEAADGGEVPLEDLAESIGIELPPVATDPFGGPGSDLPDAEPLPAPTPGETGSESAPEAAAEEAPPAEPVAVPESEQPSAADEPIETVQTERFEDSGERIEVMSNQEYLKAHPPEESVEDGEHDHEEEVEERAEAGDSPIEEAASPEADDAEDDRVSALLAEGQAAFDQGEYQNAIDSWSRVFLIDLDHSDASQKIEEAKRLLAEREREAEELFHAAIEKLESGDTEGARESLEATLERQPGHIGAREHLERLKAGVKPSEGEAGDESVGDDDLTAAPEEPIGPAETVGVGDVELSSAGEMSGTPMIDDSMAGGPQQQRIFGLSRQFLAIAAVGLVIVLAGAWYLYSRRDSVFPNSADSASENGEVHPIERAQRLHARGRAQAAIAAVERVPVTDARHGEAQTLATQWREEMAAAESTELEQLEEAEAQEADTRAELIAAARDAADAGLYHRTLLNLDSAAAMAPLSEAEESMRAAADDAMKPYGSAWAAFRDGDYRASIAPLWLQLRDSPDDAIVRDLVVTAQFNLARSALVSGNASDAATLLAEAAKLAPGDEQVSQALRFAEHYVGQPQDLRYRIFIKNLAKR